MEISAIVADARIPGSTEGIGLAEWIGEHAPELPVIVCSGIDMRVNLITTDSAIARVISKPSMPNDIARLVVGLIR